MPWKRKYSFEDQALAQGRIAKHVLTPANVLEKSTYYVLDASGNTISVYERTVNVSSQTIAFYQAEKHIYGSSRLGVLQEDIPLLGSQNSTYSMRSIKHRIGLRTYELSNHLGNVLSVISDKIIPHDDGHGSIDYYLADIRVAQDYSPFGVTLSGRNLTLAGAEESRYGYQGQEHDDEIKGEGNSVNYKYRMHDPRLGRFFAVDPLTKEYPWYSPYSFSGNKVIAWGELEGLEEYYRADGSYIGCVGGNHEMRVISSPEVENNVNYAIHREQKLLTHTNEYKYDVDFAKKNSELMFDVNKLKKMPPSDRLGNKTDNSPIVKSSKVTEDKTLIDKVRDWERKNRTEAEGGSHGSDIENSGDGGKFSGSDPFDGWWTGTGENYIPEKPKAGVTVVTEKEKFYDKNGYDSIKATIAHTNTTDKKGKTKSTKTWVSVFYKDGDSIVQNNMKK